MRYSIISTGSKGNAVVINDNILIDCGVSFKKLADYSSYLKLVLLTHCHSDHFNKKTIKRLAFERPTLRFVCGLWLIDELIACGVSKYKIDVISYGNKYNYNFCEIIPVPLVHNVSQCGYKVRIGNEKMIYCTDTNSLDGVVAKNYDLYMIEADYEEEEIKQRISEKEKNGEFVYEYDVLQNHLSKEKADKWLLENIDSNNFIVEYMHRHEVTNDGV